MSHGVITRRLFACAVTGALCAAAPAAAAASSTARFTGPGLDVAITRPAGLSAAGTASCAQPALSEPFAALHDTNAYALVPGESADNLSGAGWLLSGGAKIVRTKLADGSTGSVLELPAGGVAISAAMCLTDSYPTVRMMLHGAAGSAGVSLYVSYLARLRRSSRPARWRTRRPGGRRLERSASIPATSADGSWPGSCSSGGAPTTSSTTSMSIRG